jgi:hypothetical protein
LNAAVAKLDFSSKLVFSNAGDVNFGFDGMLGTYYEFVKDPSLENVIRLGGDLLQAVPFTRGVAGGARTLGKDLSPYVSKATKTYKATSDIPSAYNRLRNAIYSGSTAHELPGDMMHHAYFRMTPEQVTAKIAAEKAGAPAGAMLGDLNMSINSTPLYFTNATREAKAFTPIRTGEMQLTNSYGWRGKRVEDAIPFEIKQKYSKELSEFKNTQLDWENRIKKTLGIENVEYLCELKYDGASISITYKNGKLEKEKILRETEMAQVQLDLARAELALKQPLCQSKGINLKL